MHNEKQSWEAVMRRDGRWDGMFVYAVRSTGIYCRPSCPSRRPRREQVRFFAEPAEAERAGFRACLRCRPQQAPPQPELVAGVCQYIGAHLDADLSLAALAAAGGCSPDHLRRVFRRVLGISPKAYADAVRMKHIKAGLKDGRPVADSLYDAGFGASSRLYERAPSQLGMTPAIYRRGAPGVAIRYTTVRCPLGWLLVAATARGLCAVSLGDSAAALEAALRDEYPRAALERDGHALAEWTAVLLRHLEGREPCPALPLDVRATAFQRRVWEELRRIPPGQTRSYGEVARRLRRPGAARAVARACASNPLALAIPCHRVVREDGEPSGYRWGPRRKEQILAREEVYRRP